MPVKMIDHRVVYKDPQYYCGPGPAVVADEAGGLVVAFRRVPSWLEYGHAGHWHPATELCGAGRRAAPPESARPGGGARQRAGNGGRRSVDHGAQHRRPQGLSLPFTGRGPEVCLLPDGRAFAVYYINRREDAANNTAPRYL